MPIITWLRNRWQPKTLGERGEDVAARYLKRLGYKIVLRRHRQRYGEVDIIAVDGQAVVFIEVKTRRDASGGRPAEAVDHERQQRQTRAALAFLKSHGLLEYASRFDVIEVLWPAERRRPEVRHIMNAFEAIGERQMFS